MLWLTKTFLMNLSKAAVPILLPVFIEMAFAEPIPLMQAGMWFVL